MTSFTVTTYVEKTITEPVEEDFDFSLPYLNTLPVEDMEAHLTRFIDARENGQEEDELAGALCDLVVAIRENIHGRIYKASGRDGAAEHCARFEKFLNRFPDLVSKTYIAKTLKEDLFND